MLKRLTIAMFLAVPLAAGAQSLEPGEWEFNTSTTAPLIPKPQTSTAKRCVKKEEADDPELWMGQQAKKNDCKFTPLTRSADSMTWEVSCPRSKMTGTGSAKIGADGTLDSQLKMLGEIQGRKFELNTRMTGRRLGPCAS